jgi:hypothetical protein
MPSTHFYSCDHLPIKNKLGNYQPNGDEEYIEEEILDDGQWSMMNSYSSEDLPADIRLLLVIFTCSNIKNRRIRLIIYSHKFSKQSID